MMVPRRSCVCALAVMALIVMGGTVVSAELEENDRETKYWSELLRGKEKELSLIEREMQIYYREIAERVLRLEAMRRLVEVRTHQFTFALIASTRSPYEFRLLCKDIYSLVTKGRHERDEAERLLGEINEGLRMLSLMRAEMESLKGDTKDIPPEMRETAGRIVNLLADLEGKLLTRRDSLAGELAKFNEQRDVWRASFEKFEKDIPARLTAYFFNVDASVFSVETWSYVSFSCHEWVEMLPYTLARKVPDETRKWFLIGFCVCVGLLFFTVARMVLVRRVYPAWGVKVESMGLFRDALLWASLAGGLFLASVMLKFPETVLLTRLAVILVARAAMDFSWGLRLTHVDADRRSPLAPLFWLYVAGMTCQILDVNAVLLCLVWPTLLVLVCVRLRAGLSGKYRQITKRVIWISLGLVAAFCVLSLAGYSMLSMFLSYVLFITLLGTQFGMSFGALFREAIMRERGRLGELPTATLLGIGIPLAWFAIIAFLTVWAADQFIELSVLAKLVSKKVMFEGVVISIPIIAIVVFLFFVCKTFIGVLHTSLERYLVGVRIDSGSLPSLKRLITYAGWFAYFLVVLKVFDVKLTNFAVVAGGLGVGIGIGLQNVVNNFVSGLMILFGRTVRPGDTIQIGPRWAKVVDVNIRSTVIKTNDNAIITIPNSNLISGELTNWTLNDPYFRAEIKVGVAYGSDVPTVERLLIGVASSDERILKEPEPRVLLSDLADSSMIFTRRVWFDVSHDPYVQSELRRKIVKVFEENRIVVPYPQMDVHLSKEA